jgi:hypothetical protein
MASAANGVVSNSGLLASIEPRVTQIQPSAPSNFTPCCCPFGSATAPFHSLAAVHWQQSPSESLSTSPRPARASSLRRVGCHQHHTMRQYGRTATRFSRHLAPCLHSRSARSPVNRPLPMQQRLIEPTRSGTSSAEMLLLRPLRLFGENVVRWYS